MNEFGMSIWQNDNEMESSMNSDKRTDSVYDIRRDDWKETETFNEMNNDKSVRIINRRIRRDGKWGVLTENSKPTVYDPYKPLCND